MVSSNFTIDVSAATPREASPPDAGTATLPDAARGEVVVEESQESWSLRRWESADTHRLNSAQWARAQDTPVNDDLSGKLETLRARCEWEAANNPMVAGAIVTHQVDVVGEDGPELQVEVEDSSWTEDERREYAEAIEMQWRDWFHMPDAAGLRTGAEMLRQWVRQIDWTKGEFFEQFVSVFDDRAVTLRCLPINPKRVKTPLQNTGSPRIVMGVERDGFGRPQRYHVETLTHTGDSSVMGPLTEPVPHDLMLHGFVPVEPDQARGIPGLSVSLQPITDARQYDEFVLDAAKNQADRSVYLYTRHPDAPFLPVNESVDVERNTMQTMPPGWEVAMAQATQPSAQYIDFRKEKHIEIGRHVSMPLLAIRADASRHNFSSAHFDSQSYGRANAMRQQRLGVFLTRLLHEVRNELRSIAAMGDDPRVPAILARTPARVKVQWKGWPTRPHVDPNKVRNANQIALGTFQQTLSDVLAGDGKELDEHLRQWRRELLEMQKIEVRPGLTMLDLFLAAIQPPNHELAEIVDDEDDADDGEPAGSQKQQNMQPAGAMA